MSTFHQRGPLQDAYGAEHMKVPTEALAQLKKTENVVERGDDLHWKLESCRYELEELEIRLEVGLGDSAKTGKKRLAPHGSFKEGETSAGNSCDEEVTSLEGEIARMRSETPEKELKVTEKETEVLEKDYSKLFSIQEERARLKKSNQELKLSCRGSEEKLKILDCDVDHSTLEKVKEKLLTIQETAAERHGLPIQFQWLERKLSDHPEGTKGFHRRPLLLDDILESLRAGQVEQNPALEERLAQKADRVEELERQLLLSTKEVQSAEHDLDGMRTKCAMAEIEALNQKTETETLKSKIVCMEHEMESLKSMCKEQESLQMQKNRLQVSLDELVRMQDDYEHMRMQMKAVDVIRAERDRYKRKCEQLTGLESEYNLLKTRTTLIEQEKDSLQKQAEDLKKYVCEQELEIKGLVCHISCLARGKEQQQARMKEDVFRLKLELEEKKNRLAISEEDIATLNMKIETSLCNLTNEAVQLRQDKENLQKSLKCITQEKLEIERQYHELEEINSDLNGELQRKLKEIQDQETQLSDKNRAIETMQKVLNDRGNFQNNQITELTRRQAELGKVNVENQQLSLETRTSSEASYQVKDMLEQAKCAIKCIAQELEQQYAEWDSNEGRIRCCPGCNNKKSAVQKQVIIRDCAGCICKQKRPDLQSRKVQCSCQSTCNHKRTMQPKPEDSTSRGTPTKKSSEEPQSLGLKLSNDHKEDVEDDAMFTARSIEDSLAKLAELKAELLRANETIVNLRQELAEAQRTAAENLTLRKHLNRTLDDMKRMEAEGSAALLDVENSNLKKYLEDALENVRKSGNEVSCLMVENSNLKQRLAQLEAESAKLKSDMDLARNFLRKRNNESRQLQDNNKQYKRKNGELEEEIVDLRRRLNLTIRPIEVTDTNIRLLQEKLSKLREDLNATRNEARASCQGNSQLCSSNINLEAALKTKAAAETRTNHLKGTVDSFKNQLTQLDEANKRLQMEKSSLSENMKRATTNLNVERDRGKQRKHIKQMENRHSDLKSLASVLVQEVVKERKKSLKLQKERDEIGKQLQASFAKVEGLERRVMTLIKEKEETVKEKLKVIEEGDKLTKKKVDLEQHMEEAKGKSEILQSHVKTVDEELLYKRRSNFEDPKLKKKKPTLATFEIASSPVVYLNLSSPSSDDEKALYDRKLRAINLSDLLKRGSTKGFRALTVGELQFVHKYLSEGATKALERLGQKAGVLRPREGLDRFFRLHRVAELVGDLLRRQSQTPQKIAQRQKGIKSKNCESWELRKELKSEKKRTPMKESRRKISEGVDALEKIMSQLQKQLNEELIKVKLKEKLGRPESPRKKLAAVEDANMLKKKEHQAPYSAGSS